MEWNPNKPKVIGAEFPPRSGDPLPEYAIDAPYRVAAQRVDATVSETIVALSAQVNSAPGTSPIMLAEVLLAGQEVQPVTTTIYRPTEVTFSENVETQAGSSTAADILDVLERSDPNAAQYITTDLTSGIGAGVGLQFDLAGQLTGRRIVDVRVVMVGGDNGGTDESNSSSDAGVDVTIGPAPDAGLATALMLVSAGISARSFVGTGVTEIATTGEMYPPSVAAQDGGEVTEPWRVAQLLTLDDSAANELRVTWGLGDDDPSTRHIRLYTVHLEVDHVAENRVARNTISGSTVGVATESWVPHKPTDGSDNFAKVNGTDLTFVLRRPYYGIFNGYAAVPSARDLRPTAASADYSFSVPYIEAVTDGVPVGLEHYSNAAVNSDGTFALLGDPAGNRVMPFGMWTAAGPSTMTVDSQPYAAVTTVPITGTVQQEVSGASAQNYDGVLVPLRAILDGGLVGPLVVELRRRSDSNLMATATITQALAESFTADPTAGWRRVQAPFAAPALLAAATQYYLTFASTAPGSWEVPSLEAFPDLVGISGGLGLATYVGTTDVATYGAGDQAHADIPALVYVEPDVVTNFEAVAGFIPLDIDPACEEVFEASCIVTALGVVDLSWDPHVDPDLVVEIQRRDAFTDWQTIGVVTDENVGQFQDQEGLLDQSSDYRVRTVSIGTGLFSPWSATMSATRLSYGASYTFTSNEQPGLGVAYGDIYTGGAAVRDYEFLTAAERIYRTVYGRDFQIGFSPLERRGIRFNRVLLVDAFTTVDRQGPSAFDALLEISLASLSYVCCCDSDGNRWYGGLDVPAGHVRKLQAGTRQAAWADIVFTQTTDLSSQPDVVASGM